MNNVKFLADCYFQTSLDMKAASPFRSWVHWVVSLRDVTEGAVSTLALSAKEYARQFILWKVWMANIWQKELFSWVLFACVQNLLWDKKKKKLHQILGFVDSKKKLEQVHHKGYEIMNL